MLHDPVGSLLKLLMLSVDAWFFEKCTSVHLVEDANSWIRFCIPARSFKVCSVLYIGAHLTGPAKEELLRGWVQMKLGRAGSGPWATSWPSLLEAVMKVWKRKPRVKKIIQQ
jgi:hypothetical protein